MSGSSGSRTRGSVAALVACTDDPRDDRLLSWQAGPAVIASLTIIRFTSATYYLIK